MSAFDKIIKMMRIVVVIGFLNIKADVKAHNIEVQTCAFEQGCRVSTSTL